MIPFLSLSVAGLSGLLPSLNMRTADYGWPLASMGAAIATSFLIFKLSVTIAPHAAPLAAIGRGSLTIMYLHVPLIHYLSPYMDKLPLLALALSAPFALDRLIRLSPRATRWLL